MCAHFTPRSYWAMLGTQLRGVIEHDCSLHGVTACARSLYSAELLRKFENSTPRSDCTCVLTLLRGVIGQVWRLSSAEVLSMIVHSAE